MIEVPQSNHHTKLTWKGLKTESSRSASMSCSNGHLCVLIDHVIDFDGFVSPSVVCPYEGCDFHEMVHLVGWKETYPCEVCGKPNVHLDVAEVTGIIIITHAYCQEHLDALGSP